MENQMHRLRLASLGFLTAVLAGCFASNQPPANREAERLEGTWEITSVQRNGEAESRQIGAPLTFAGDKVKFQPKEIEFTDGLG
jgi:hypothetical protein